ncbi:MAG: ribokinase [Acidothermus sp.]|nr:ribokinase [Acidothermus sp.]MCL6537204.1 ribokinase [Acidothermus sp.]
MPDVANTTQPRDRPRVIVVGSVNEDLLISVEHLPRPGETVAAHSMRVLPGGKSANQAVAAARAGAVVCFIGAVGADVAGKQALDALGDEGVDTSQTVVVEGSPTGKALVLVEESGENEIVIVAGANAQLSGGHVGAALKALNVTTCDVLLVGFEIDDDPVLASARYAEEAGCTFLVNPAPVRGLPEGLVAVHPILVLNRSEASLLAGEDDVEDAARSLTRSTGAPVVVTLGAAGALVVHGAVLHVPAPSVPAVDTTGAGDTFAGVCAAALTAGLDLVAAARRAVAAAALSVTAVGARSAMPHAQEIDAAISGLR